MSRFEHCIRFVSWGAFLVFAMAMVPRVSAEAADEGGGRLPAIGHVVEAVEQGGTLTLFGEGLSPEVQVWLWQPSPNAPAVLRSEEALDELRQMALAFPDLPPLPDEPPGEAQPAERLGDPGNPRVAMVRQLGSAHPAWDDSHILPTVIWIEHEAGYSAPYLVNGPQLWFASESAAVPGERLRLFGTNLFGGPNNPSQSLIALRNPDSGEVFWGRQLRRYNQEHPNVRQHEISFRLPAELPPGNYEVRVHHLAGGPHGWSNGLTVEIVDRRSVVAQMGRGDESSHATPEERHFPEPPPVFRVTEAAGDGLTDDGPTIQEMLDEAAAVGGGLVVLPAGRFAVRKPLVVPADVVLQGAGREASSLTVSPLAPITAGHRRKAAVAMVEMRTRSGIQDLAVIAGPGVDINVKVEDQAVVEDVFLRRVRIENTHAYLWDQEATNWENPDFGLLVNSASRGFRLLQSEIVAPMTFRMEGYGRRHRHAHIAGNRFETYPHHGEDNVFLLAISESIFENNVMAYGHRAFTSQRGTWRNFIAHNQTLDIHGVGNGSEIFMSEYGHSLYDGPIEPAEDAAGTLRLPQAVEDELLEQLRSVGRHEDIYAFVVSGPGFGQLRRVVEQDGRTLSLDHPWRIPPEAESEVMLLTSTTQNLLINNANLSGRGVYAFFYGAAVDNVLAGNEASGGGVTSIWISAVAHTDDTALVAYNTFANNRLVLNGGIHLAALDWSRDEGRPPLVIGNRLVRNQVWRPGEFGSPNQHYAAWNWQGGPSAGHGWIEPGRRKGIAIWGGSYNVVENNYVDGAEAGLHAGPGRGTSAARAPVRGNFFRWNRIDRTETAVDDQGEAGYVEPPAYQSYGATGQ